MSRTAVLLAVILAALLPARAHADYQADAALVEDIAGGFVNRARRAIAIGPHVGGFGGSSVSPGDGLGGISFGLALYTFEIPGVFDIKALVAARLEARVQERVKQIIASGGAAPTDLTAIAREVAEDVRAEVFGEVLAPRLLERPGFGVVVEGIRLLSPDGWQGRIGVNKGISFASLGLGAGVQRAGGETAALVGLDLSVRLTPTGTLRTPVLDLFARYDVAFRDGDRGHTFVVGGRALFDLL